MEENKVNQDVNQDVSDEENLSQFPDTQIRIDVSGSK